MERVPAIVVERIAKAANRDDKIDWKADIPHHHEADHLGPRVEIAERASGQMSLIDDVSFCPPDSGIDLRDVRQTFLAFLAADPARRAIGAGLSVLEALENRYPCQGPQALSVEAVLLGTH
jgi:hypothetical protein